ncbi:hypothetical protein BJV74DRAFT_286101 [Russula compacta]|nr:hypothetical protein BJV74DRAFT_286101 [Russula compacta]
MYLFAARLCASCLLPIVTLGILSRRLRNTSISDLILADKNQGSKTDQNLERSFLFQQGFGRSSAGSSMSELKILQSPLRSRLKKQRLSLIPSACTLAHTAYCISYHWITSHRPRVSSVRSVPYTWLTLHRPIVLDSRCGAREFLIAQRTFPRTKRWGSISPFWSLGPGSCSESSHRVTPCPWLPCARIT